MDEQTSAAAPTPGVGQVMDIAPPQQVIEPTVSPTPTDTSNPSVLQPSSVGSTIPVSISEPEPPVSQTPVTQTENIPTESAEPNPPPELPVQPMASDPLTPVQPAPSSEPTPEAPPTNNPDESKPDESKPATDQQTSQKPHEPHKKAPVIAIVIAVVVAIGLAGVVIFAYMQSQNSDNIERTDTQTVTEKPQASVTDVDTASQEIDSELEKANDDADFASTDLDDSTLGL